MSFDAGPITGRALLVEGQEHTFAIVEATLFEDNCLILWVIDPRDDKRKEFRVYRHNRALFHEMEKHCRKHKDSVSSLVGCRIEWRVEPRFGQGALRFESK
jgi:hypothetical protein